MRRSYRNEATKWRIKNKLISNSSKSKKYTGVIYKVTNTLIENNNIYIGKTSLFNKRKSAHIRSSKNGGCTKFHKALSLYGVDKFKWEIIDTFYNHQESYIKERRWINKFNSLKNGYNSC